MGAPGRRGRGRLSRLGERSCDAPIELLEHRLIKVYIICQFVSGFGAIGERQSEGGAGEREQKREN